MSFSAIGPPPLQAFKCLATSKEGTALDQEIWNTTVLRCRYAESTCRYFTESGDLDSTFAPTSCPKAAQPVASTSTKVTSRTPSPSPTQVTNTSRALVLQVPTTTQLPSTSSTIDLPGSSSSPASDSLQPPAAITSTPAVPDAPSQQSGVSTTSLQIIAITVSSALVLFAILGVIYWKYRNRRKTLDLENLGYKPKPFLPTRPSPTAPILSPPPMRQLPPSMKTSLIVQKRHSDPFKDPVQPASQASIHVGRGSGAD